MTELLSSLENAPRLLCEARLVPLQTHRFQPTGFPDLGAAAYGLPDGTQMLLVESAQSVANRLEAAVWDEARGEPLACLEGMPYVEVSGPEGIVTNSILEAHRLNSPYILEGRDTSFLQMLKEELGTEGTGAVDRSKLAATVLRYDPNAVLHGVFLAKKDLAGGRHRMTRALSGFIEAEGVRPAESGGVKNDRVDPGGDTSKGFGNVPFHRTEYVAKEIRACFNLDLDLLRSYRLPGEALEFLVTLALFKVQRFLSRGMRLRTACDLEGLKGLRVDRPEGFEAPREADLAARLPRLIEACATAGLFAKPPVTTLSWTPKPAAKGRGKAKAAGEENGEADE